MSWRDITIDNVRLTPQEKASLEAIQGSSNIGTEILENTIAEFRSAIASAGHSLPSDKKDGKKIPDLVRHHVINRTRWLWLCEFPQLKTLQTKEREALNEAAEKIITAISSREMNVEPPTGAVETSGNWNSQPKVIGRMANTPRPSQQTTATYANPEGPEDE